jgi:hypothetical protein
LHPGRKQTKTGADAKNMIRYQQIAIVGSAAKMFPKFLVLSGSLLFVDQGRNQKRHENEDTPAFPFWA